MIGEFRSLRRALGGRPDSATLSMLIAGISVRQKSYRRHPYDDSDANFCSEPNGVHLISQIFRVDPRCEARYAKVLFEINP